MKNKITRIIAVVLAMLLSLQLLVVADDTAYESDKNYTYFKVFSKLEILPTAIAEKDPSLAITRGEFAYLAAGAFGLPSTNSNRYYSDVDYAKEYAGSIMSLHDAGIVSGNANGSFYPEAAITPTDAAVILTRLLGYETMAKQYGGYESGYLVAANEIGLFKGVASDGTTLSVSDAVRLVFNSLTADRMEDHSYNGITRFEITEDSSRLLKTYGLKYTSGVVEKNAYTSLSATEGFAREYISVDGVTYYDPDGLAQNLLGYHADILYEEDDDGTLSIFLIYASKKNNVVRFDADDVFKTDGQTIYFDAQGEDRSADVKFNASIIYNEVADLTSNGLDFIPEYGEITLIDNNGDHEYDVVFVSAYQTLVVFGVDDDSIRDADGNVVDFSTVEDDRRVVYKNGKEIEITQIAAKDVASICFSKSGDSVTIYVSEDKVRGVLKQYFDDEYTIDESEYIVTSACMKDIAEGRIKQPKAGAEVVAYLDFKGNIAYFEEEKFGGYYYGYVMAIDEAADGALTDKLLRVMNHNGEVDDLVLEPAVTVDLNPAKVSVTNLISNYLKSGDELIHQLVKYKKNHKNQLTDINFAKTTEQTNDEMLELSYILNMTYSGPDGYYQQDANGRPTSTKNPGVDDRAVNVVPPAQSAEAYCWRPSGRCFDGYAPVNEDTVFFMVPYAEAEITDPTRYKVSNYTLLANDQKYNNLYIYDKGEAGVVNVVLVAGSASGTINPNQAVAVISDIKTTLDADGTEVLSISYMHGGSIKSGVTRTEVNYSIDDYYGLEPIDAAALTDATGIGIGDVVYVETDTDGKINNIYRITDASNVADMTAGVTNPSSATYKSARTFYGKMLDIKGTTYEITDEAGTITEPVSAHYTGTRYTYVDLTAKKVTPVKVTVDYLNRCSNNDNYRLLLKMMNAAVLDCVIYKVQ